MDLADDLRRVPSDDVKRGHIMQDHCTHPDDGVLANANIFPDAAIESDVGTLTDGIPGCNEYRESMICVG